MAKEKKVEDEHSEQEAVEEKKDKVLKTEKKKDKKKWLHKPVSLK